MMMAHDSSAGRPQLSAESVSELTSALGRYAANESDVAAIQPALRAIAREAGTSGRSLSIPPVRRPPVDRPASRRAGFSWQVNFVARDKVRKWKRGGGL